MKSYILPTLTTIAKTFSQNSQLLVDALEATAIEAAVGLAVGAAIGFILGVLCYYTRPIRTPTTIILIALTSVPLIGLAPIAVLIFGSGLLSKIVLVAFVTVFSLTLYTVSALEQCPPDLERLLTAFGTTEPVTFRILRLRAAAPAVLTGLRFAAGQAVLMAIIGEMFSAQRGVGAVILQQGAVAGYDVMWAASMEGALAGLAFFLIASLPVRFLK